MLKRLTGLRYDAPLREGGSLPAIVETDAPGPYVVKFRGAGQGAKALIAEALAAGLALALGLPLPDPALVEIDAGFGRGEPDPEIQDILRGSVGANFGLAYLPGSIAFDPAADRVVDPDLAAAIVWFDAFITNIDRTARNTNLLLWRERLYLIDHGASLYFQHRWEGYEARIRSPFPQIRDHVLLPFAGDIAAAGARLAPLVGEEVLRRVVDGLPDEWLAGEPHFAAAGLAAHRDAYAGFLLGRLGPPRPFEREASDAAAALRLV
jgi:hypothetical protein